MAAKNFSIRRVLSTDAAAIADIYNHEILNSTATFDTEPVTVAERAQWISSHQSPKHPVFVAAEEGTVLGWASLSAWSDRCAYARAVEVSIYVDQGARGRGVGSALMDALKEAAKDAGLGVLLARVCTEMDGSLRLHRRAGFGTIGIMRGVGEKFGRILDIELLDFHVS